MGSVWRARHRTLGRSFAIKFLKTTILGGESLEQRFLDEARMAASIQHRFVVDIVDFGVNAEAIPFMVMEFLHGESLDHRCRRLPPLPVVELLRVGAEVLLGLEAVHQAGIVHRDLKPENIMLVQEADGIIPKLVDFGISQLEVEPAEGRKRNTSPGAVLGTPWYMSPEQARRDEIDRRADIYSLGVILYEALTGVPPFDHQEMGALLELVRRGGATPLHQQRPELGEELSAVIERAMALDPAARFQSAAQMAATLVEVSARLLPSLECASPPSVSRTDTELVDRPPPPRTHELGPAPSLFLPPPRWRSRRALAVAGATAGAVLLLWMTVRGRAGTGTAPATAQAAVAASTAVSTEVVPGGGEDPATPQPASERSPTFTAAAGGPGSVAVERQQARRPAAHGARREGAGRAALPDVFRTPGF